VKERRHEKEKKQLEKEAKMHEVHQKKCKQFEKFTNGRDCFVYEMNI
jgi:predicted Ser/Thr protein kinase